MKLDLVRQMFRPLFGLERRETTSRFLYTILISGLIIDFAVIVFRVLRGTGLFGTTLVVLGSLFILQVILLIVVKRGYSNLAAQILIVAGWVAITYQAWSIDGVRDAALYVYVLIIFIAALLTNWQMSAALSILSILVIWFLAISEARGLRVPHTDSPLNIAGDLTAVFIILFLLVYLVMNTVRYSLSAVSAGEQKFRKIFHVSPVAIAISSLNEGRLIDANAAYWRLTGFDPSFALGRTTIELGTWRDDAERQKFLSTLKEQKSFHNPAYQIKSQTGEQRTTLA